MRGINKAIILGRLGADPQSFTFEDGNVIANFSVATSETWTDREGNPQESTQWHKVRLSGKLAELGLRLLAKGSHVYIEGPIKTRKWTDKNNQTQYTTEIYAEKFELLASGKNLNADSNQTTQSDSRVVPKAQSLPQQINPNLINESNDPGWIPF